MASEQTITVTVPDAKTSAPVAGFKSTEFASMLITVVTIAAGVIPPQYAPIVAGLVGVYVACRTALKAAHVLGYARQLPDLPAIPDLPIPTTIQVQP